MNHDPTAWAKLGVAIRDDRNRQGLTRDQLSDLTAAHGRRVSARTIGTIERGAVKGGKPPSLEPAVSALGWKPGWADRILAGEDPGAVLRRDADAAPIASPRSRLLELVPSVYEFSREAVRMGADPQLRDQFDRIAQRLVESVPSDGPVRSAYDLAAYRPHAEGEGIPADDAARIYDAMNQG